MGKAPHHSRSLFFFLGLLALALGGCQTSQAPQGLRLAELVPIARRGFIVCPADRAGSNAFRAYLGTGLRPETRGNRAISESDASIEALRFFLYQPRPLRLEIEAQRLTGPRDRPVKLRLGEARFECRLDAPLRLEVPAESLRPGLNTLTVSGANGVAWSRFLVSPAQAAPSLLSGEALLPNLSADKTEILLPFGQPLDFPVQMQGDGELRLTVAPWLEDGAPPYPAARARLQVVRYSQAGSPVSLTLAGCGESTASLPGPSGRCGVQLLATLDGEAPLPGQVGLRLSAATLSAASPPTLAPTDSGPASPPTGFPGRDARTTRPPNVILIVVDTLRADHLSLYGYPHPTSPCLEALAKDAITFDRVNAQSSWTKPTVASILTGLEPGRHGVLDFADILGDDLTTWAEVLEQGGYQTMAIVTNGLIGKVFGFNQGFETFVTRPVTTRADELQSQGRALLRKRDPSRPFFLYLHAIDPHQPYTPPQPYRGQAALWHRVKEPRAAEHAHFGSVDRAGFARLDQYAFIQATSGLPLRLPEDTLALVRSLYDGEVASTDAAIGSFLEWLKGEGLYEDSLIVVTSDHGEQLLERDWLGHTQSLHKEVLDVPLLIKLPRGREGGARVQEVYQQVDILPTVLSQLSLPLPGPLDGHPYPHSTPFRAFFELDCGWDAEEMGQASTDYREVGHGLRDARWRMYHYEQSVKPMEFRALYDLENDPEETRNLATELPLEMLFLEAELARHREHRIPPRSEKLTTEKAKGVMRSLDYLH